MNKEIKNTETNSHKKRNKSKINFPKETLERIARALLDD